MSQTETPSPIVLIAGAGLGGLTAAIMCEKANINYMVLERAVNVRLLGSAMCLNAHVQPILEQLQLLDELKSISLPCLSLDTYNDKLELLGGLGLTTYRDLTGYDSLIMARPNLYALLLSKVPAEKILRNKKIVSVEQDVNGVTVQCADNSTYTGDILIGADGAYSTVKQCMYKDMDEKGLLPKEDKEDMAMASICMLGMTKPLDPAKYPALKSTHSHFSTVLGKGKPHSWSTITMTGNRIAWSGSFPVDAEAAEKVKFRNDEWGPEANKAMIEEISNFPLVHGGVMKDLIDASDKDLISRVYIEEKLFKTWHHGRIALIGDAAHKMQPSGGQGAVSAIQDACILLNSIYELNDTTYESICAALAEYPPQRRDRIAHQFKLSQDFAKVVHGQVISHRGRRKRHKKQH
ncbi:MAG: hypothetical protein BYD32DRAFT_403771 [Podila humilis]|nr:MAG: hypothetical protein BYD32DRAFT_403771 [Podila humilis]